MWLTVSGHTIHPSRDWEVAGHTLLSQEAERKRDREREEERQTEMGERDREAHRE